MKLYTDRFVLTPGPTEIPHRVRMALTRETTNPDLDPEFFEVYDNVRRMLRELLGAKSSSLYVLTAEAVLGLEAAVANLVKPGEKVVVVANGVYGEGFGDFVKSYGGVPLYVGTDWRMSVDLAELDRALEKNPDSTSVTLVHCDTPSALLNDLSGVAKIAKSHGKLLVVDAVSSVGAVPVDFDEVGVDVLIGGSQKVLNAPTGLTVVAVSKAAWERIEEVGYRGYYMNMRAWRDMIDYKRVFPHSMSDVLIYALEESLKMLFEEGLESVYRRHQLARRASWEALGAMGLEPYPLELEYSSPTVTAFCVPPGLSDVSIRETMWSKYGVMIAGSWGRLQGKLLRIGHMGVQASRDYLLIAYTALARVLKDLGRDVSVGRVVDAIDGVLTRAG